MSWADDIRCLYCDGKLPLYRKITNGQFCSGAHRKAYWQEHERLAVERLHQTHDSLRAYRPAGAVEAILGPAAAAEDEATLEMPVYVPQAQPAAPTYLYTEFAEPKMAKLIPPPVFRLPRWLPDYVAIVDVHPIESSTTLLRPSNVFTLSAPEVITASPVLYSKPEARQPEAMAIGTEAILPNVDGAHPEITLTLDAAPQFAAQLEERQQLVDQDIPEQAGLLALSQPALRNTAKLDTPAVSAAAVVLRVQLPLNKLSMEATLFRGSLLHAGLRQLPVATVAIAQSTISQDGLRAIDLRSSNEAPQFPLAPTALAPRLPRLKLAAGSRYRVETQSSAPIVAAELQNFAAVPPEISLPERSVKVMKAAAGASQSVTAFEQAPPLLNLEFQPNAMGMMPLACNAQPSLPSIEMRPAPAALSLPQPLEPRPIRPDSHLEPLDTKPTSDSIAASQPMRPPQSSDADEKQGHIWMLPVDFWNRAPRDLKMLVVAIPVLLGLALHPALPKVRVAGPAAANGIQKKMSGAFGGQWQNVRQTMLDRAAVALDEDFRQGLDEWVSRGDATAEWSFDATGFVRPGPLALYRPSMNLTDYQMQFLGVLDKQALSWVVRAADYDNFYVIKLETLKAGPLPTIGVVRYAVVNGKADARADTIAPLDARTDMLYRVRVDVRGDDFSLFVQGQLVDSWTEPRLKRGGIGFYSSRGEESRLRWVQVTHQYDMLGRLCAYLAPYNIPSSGSLQ